MPVFGNDLICQGYKVIDAVLTDAKLDELVGPPEPGKIYKFADGTPYYVTAAGVPTPFHENSIQVVDVPDGSPLTATTNGRVVQLDITPADATNSGTLSPAYYDLLSNASNGNIPGTLVVRGNDSPTSFEIVSATAITIDAPPDVNFSSYGDTFVVPKGYIDDAIVTATEALDTGVSVVTGIGAITATPPDEDGVVEISIATATSTNPGTQSPEHFALLDAATTELGSFAGKLVVAQDWGGGTFLTSLGSVQADSVHARAIYSDLPTTDHEVTNKIYVDGAIATATQDLAASIGGRDFKSDVLLAYDTNVSLSAAPPAQEGVTPSLNQSVLLVNQTDLTENGAYLYNGTTLVRRPDSNGNQLSAGAVYPVTSGKYSGQQFMLTSVDFTIGTDPITFVNSSDMSIAGMGLVKDGRIFHVRGTPGQIDVAPDGVGISTTYAGQASIITLGTITQGTWNGNLIGMAYGGTGAATVVDARSNLQVYSKAEVDSAVVTAITGRKYAQTIGNGTETSYTVVHNLATEDITYSLRDVNSKEFVYTDIRVMDANSVRVDFGSPASANSYRLVITG